MKIAIIGGGYVGLVSGACFAEFGVEVAVYEADPAKRAMLLQGKIPIYEPGLDKLVADNSAAGRLSFPTTLEAGISGVEAIFIAVGTPTRRGDGHADLTYVFAAVEQVVLALDHPAIIVTKSTVPVGTGRKIAELAHRLRPDLKIEVASNPEFLREGSAITDFMRPDRVVVGADTDWARDVLQRLYRPLYLIETPIVFAGLETAELIKYAANGFLAMKITFINEMADLCEKVGATSMTLPEASGWMAGSGVNSCMPPWLRRLMLPQRHPGADADCGRSRRAEPPYPIGSVGERSAQNLDGGAGDCRLRRIRRGQAHRSAGPRLQTGN